MYVKLLNNVVYELIPDIDPIFPGIDISQRYPADFISELIHVSDDTNVQQDYIYNPETGTFEAPKPPKVSEPEPVPEPEPSISIEDTTLDMLADHEARLSEIELGITTTDK